MSESAEAPKPSKKQLARYLIPIIAILLLLLVYGSGIIMLPISILSNYRNADCDTALSLSNLYTSIYPAFLEDKTLADPVMECAVYSLANRQVANSDLQEALNSYETYSATYPNGIFAKEAHEHSALMLVNLAKEQAGAKNFSQAVSSLKIVLTKYKDTDATESATDLFPEIYISWGVGLRTAGDFEGALRVFGDFKIWVESTQKPELAETVQREISQTYLDWGLQLQFQKKFEEAESKFESAKSADSTLTAQVQANEEKLYTEWGDFLIEQKDFDGAMGQYEIASNLVEDSDPDAAKAIIANGYIQWADGLSQEEDFIGALVLLDFAQETAATDAVKQYLDETRTNTYLAFSKSDGEQAQKAMKDAARIVCKHKTNPSLPIFGLDGASSKLASVYGIEGDLPKELVATTPGLLHYIVCVEENAKVIGSTKHTLYASAAGFRPYIFERLLYTWAVTLRKTDTGEETASTLIEGSDPPPFPTTDWEIYTAAFNGSTQYFGQKPDFSDLVDWLLSTEK